MLISIRQLAVPELGARVFRAIVRHPSFVVRLADYAGGIAEDRLFDAPERRTTVSDWPVLAITLAGSVLVRDHRSAVLAAERTLVWVPRGAGFRARSGEGGARALFVQWDPAVFGRLAASSVATEALRPPAFEKIRRVVQDLVAADYAAARASVAVAELFAEFRGLGLLDTRPRPDDLVFAPAEPLTRVGAAVDRALSNLCAIRWRSIYKARSVARRHRRDVCCADMERLSTCRVPG